MNAEQLEKAIVEQITALGIPAQPYPALPASYVPGINPGEALVRYSGTKYVPDDISGVRKERTQAIEIVVVSQELRGETGAYSWLDRIRMQLEGLMIVGAGGPLKLDAEEFLDEYNGIWQFGQRWNLKSNYEYEQQDDYADRSLSNGD